MLEAKPVSLTSVRPLSTGIEAGKVIKRYEFFSIVKPTFILISNDDSSPTMMVLSVRAKEAYSKLVATAALRERSSDCSTNPEKLESALAT